MKFWTIFVTISILLGCCCWSVLGTEDDFKETPPAGVRKRATTDDEWAAKEAKADTDNLKPAAPAAAADDEWDTKEVKKDKQISKKPVPLDLNNLFCQGHQLDVDPALDTFRRVCVLNAVKAKKSANTTEEKSALRVGPACIGICLWEMTLWLDGTQKLSRAEIGKFLDKAFKAPQLKTAKADLKSAHVKCEKVEGYKSGVKSTEKSCLEFKPYLDCLEKSFRELCRPENTPKGYVNKLIKPGQGGNGNGNGTAPAPAPAKGGGLLGLGLG